jgi:hypothetical protein
MRTLQAAIARRKASKPTLKEKVEKIVRVALKLDEKEKEKALNEIPKSIV